MTVAKTTGLLIGFAGAFAIGVWTAPHIGRAAEISVTRAAATSDQPASAGALTTHPAGVAAKIVALPASVDVVQQHARDLLSPGTDVKLAANGFSSAERFVMVAYAARNTDVPFVVLKNRVIGGGQSLAHAIHVSRPELNANLEVNRARAEAQADLARLSS